MNTVEELGFSVVLGCLALLSGACALAVIPVVMNL